MSKSLISYDAECMLETYTPGALASGVFQEMQPRLQYAKKQVINDWKNGHQGWIGCIDDRQIHNRIKALAQKNRRYKTCLVIGIGGSDLGSRAAYQALQCDAVGMKLEFLGANTDPDEIEQVLSRLNLKTTLVNIISKSGNTIEPMVTFAIVWERLQKVVGKKAALQIIATTDQSKGYLHDFAKKQGIEMLPVPQNIGGRFSVLTSVGLFPLACAGISIEQVVNGAKSMRNEILKQKTAGDAGRFAALHAMAMVMQQRNIHVCMPYHSKLEGFSRWFRQLWAESLGKKYDVNGSIRNIGPTPIASLGATDQHSQIQLYMEGPQDKCITFIEVKNFSSTLKVPTTIKEFPALGFLSGVQVSKIIHAERKATSQALSEAGRPNGTIMLERLDAKNMGALFFFFQFATGIVGSLLDINPYDQPGVEAGKKAMYAILHK
ncbi:glucose-6-phosphate isomerase [Candidatus Uhrbacteria bacterium]|nr:glucose-6-phosphate isomerase [Candidatus Uhrbacteria bacterium]